MTLNFLTGTRPAFRKMPCFLYKNIVFQQKRTAAMPNEHVIPDTYPNPSSSIAGNLTIGSEILKPG
jgi:hypothetical protein